MSKDVCQRIADLETQMLTTNQDHKDIILLLIKIKYTIYGSIGAIIAHEVGVVPILKGAVGL